MVKFGYTIFYVSDVTETLLFFEKAFDMKRRFLTDECDSAKPLGVEIALITDDIHSTHTNALNHGAKELKKPEQKPWGQAVSYLRCPTGILLELCTPIGDST